MMSPHFDLPTLHRCIISPVLVIKASKMIFKGWSVFVIFIFGLLGLTCLACHASLLRHDSVSGSEVLFQTTNIHTLGSEGRKDAEVMQIYYNMQDLTLDLGSCFKIGAICSVIAYWTRARCRINQNLATASKPKTRYIATFHHIDLAIIILLADSHIFSKGYTKSWRGYETGTTT